MTDPEIMASLIAHWPKVFSEKRPRPLMIGIIEALLSASGKLSHDEIKAGIRCYCGRPRYLRALKAGAHRIDLDGNPAGEVSAGEADHAKQRLKVLGERKRVAKGSAPLPHQPAPPQPLRLKGRTIEVVTIRRRRLTASRRGDDGG